MQSKEIESLLMDLTRNIVVSTQIERLHIGCPFWRNRRNDSRASRGEVIELFRPNSVVICIV